MTPMAKMIENVFAKKYFEKSTFDEAVSATFDEVSEKFPNVTMFEVEVLAESVKKTLMYAM